MTFSLTYPELSGSQANLTLEPGETLFVLGANGVGKSSLLHKFYVSNHTKTRRISAHRQTWFTSSALSLSPEQKRNTENNIQSGDTNYQSRWKDDYSSHRATIAIYDLIDAENVRARAIARAVDGENITDAVALSKKDAPIKVINELLRLSNIPIAITVIENEQVMASKNGGPLYSVAELSDGERNALLIAANVLTVKPDSLIMIDEPERHLHRSIISPLLTLLFSKRKDCAFVVSTHDVMLSVDNPSARSLLVRSCNYSGHNVTGWEADVISSSNDIDDSLLTDILGSRRQILFVEGKESSLDKPLYSLVFPNVSVVAKASCHDVEHGVAGIRDAANLHWLHAWGIVDNDRRTTEDINRLQEKGIFALPVFSVESIYYHPQLQEMAAKRQATVTGEDYAEKVKAAKTAALNAIRPHAMRLSERTVEKRLRDEMFKYLPRRNEIRNAAPINVSIDIAKFVREENFLLESFINAGDLASIIEQYPFRETPALKAIATNLGFQGPEQYEQAVLKLLMDDADALLFVKRIFGALTQSIEFPAPGNAADIVNH